MRKLIWCITLLSLTATANSPREGSQVKLYLTSAAIYVLDDLVPLLPLSVNDHTACYVTTAGNLEGSPPWMDDEIDAVSQAGFEVRRVDLAALSSDALPDAFAHCDIFFVGGGNTYYLLQEVRRSGFDKFVVEKIYDGVPYVGTSAGSLILGPDLNLDFKGIYRQILNEALALIPRSAPGIRSKGTS